MEFLCIFTIICCIFTLINNASMYIILSRFKKEKLTRSDKIRRNISKWRRGKAVDKAIKKIDNRRYKNMWRVRQCLLEMKK